MGMAQVMEAHTGQFLCRDQARTHSWVMRGLQRAAIGLCNHERLPVGADTKPQQFLGLPDTPCLKFFNHYSR
jgi:hypothetical protein